MPQMLQTSGAMDRKKGTMFKIQYTVWNVDSLNELQRSRYERWQAIAEEEIIKQYGDLNGATLSEENHREMLAREAYEQSLLTDDDRLILRVGSFVESYFHRLGDLLVNCSNVYELDRLTYWEDDLLTPEDRLFNCYLGYLGSHHAIVRVSGKRLAVVLSTCDVPVPDALGQPF